MNPADESADHNVLSLEQAVQTSDADRVTAERLDEALFYINVVKNSAAVSLSNHEVLTNLYTGQLIYVDDRDVSVAPHLMLRGYWEENSGKILRRLLSPGDVFFDVGANFGYFSLLAGIEIGPTPGGLHLFEANPDLIRYLERTLIVNGLTQYSKLNGVAVSDEIGEVKLNRIEHQWGGATVHDLETLGGYRPIKDTFDAHYQVPSITIDSYVEGNGIDTVDFMKIDVEGLEDRVYRGMAATIAANPQMKVFLEFTGGAYEDAHGFFQKMSTDFAHVYMAPDDHYGGLVEINSLADIEQYTSQEIAMLLLSNTPTV